MLDKIKHLREVTGVSVMICKKALEEAGGDEAKALEILREKAGDIAIKKSKREAKQGVVAAYIHSNKKLGVLVELRCETDFVAKNKDFQEVAHNIAMHIAASEPGSISALLSQQYIKNLDITVEEYIKSAIQKFGENIEVSRFTRYEL